MPKQRLEIEKHYNYDTLMRLIRFQFDRIIKENYELYKHYNIIIENEQMYIDHSDINDQSTIFIVVKFSSASIDHNENIIPVSFTAMAEQNGIEVTQSLLLDYAQTYNLVAGSDEEEGYEELDIKEGLTFYQSYDTPQIVSSFNEAGNSYRATIFMPGALMISYDINMVRRIIYFPNYVDEDNMGEEEEIKHITFNFNFSVNLDSQVFYNSEDVTKSQARFGTFAINVSSYLTNDKLSTLALLTALNHSINNKNKKNRINKVFYIGLEFKNEEVGLQIQKMKLSDLSVSQDKGSLPIASYTFTN